MYASKSSNCQLNPTQPAFIKEIGVCSEKLLLYCKTRLKKDVYDQLSSFSVYLLEIEMNLSVGKESALV